MANGDGGSYTYGKFPEIGRCRCFKFIIYHLSKKCFQDSKFWEHF